MEETKVLHKKKVIAPKLRFKGYNDEWKSKNIGSILSVGSGRDYKHLGNGNIPVFGTGGLMTMVDKFLYDGATVCIGRKGTIDKPMYFEGKLWTVDTLFYTHSFVESNPKFVYNLFQKIKWKEHNEASGVPSLSKTTIEKLKIYIPSLPEQQKIASFLSAVDEKIQLLNRKKQLLEQYKKGVMQQLFSGQLSFKDENGKAYPKWEEKKLGPLIQIKSGYTPSNYDFNANGINPFLKVEELNNSEKYQSESRFYTDNNENLIKKNSVIFPKRGAAILNNKVRINTVDVLIDTNLMALIPIEGVLHYEYLYYKIFSEKLYKIADCSTIPQINNKHIEPYKIPLPSYEEQKRIADFLVAIDVKIEKVAEALEATAKFKKGLLQQMFV